MLVIGLILGIIAGFSIFNIVDMIVLYFQIQKVTKMMKQILLFNGLLILAISVLWIYNYMNFK